MAKSIETGGKAAEQDNSGSAFVAWLKELAIIFGAFLLLNSFVLASFEVPTGSMEIGRAHV